MLMYLCGRPLIEQAVVETPPAVHSRTVRCGMSLGVLANPPLTAPDCPIHKQPMERIYPTMPPTGTP